MATKKPRRKTQFHVYATLDLVRDKNQLPNRSPWNIYEKFDTLDLAMARARRFIDASMTDEVSAPWEPGGLAKVRGLMGSKPGIRIEEETVRSGTHTVMSFEWSGHTWLSPTGIAANEWGRDPNRKLGPSYSTYIKNIREYGILLRESGEPRVPRVMLSYEWSDLPEEEKTRQVKFFQSSAKAMRDRLETRQSREREIARLSEKKPSSLSPAEEQYQKELALMRR